MDSLDCDGLSRDPSHTIQSECASILSPLSGVCTHQLLHQARVQTYGSDYASFSAIKPRAYIALGVAAPILYAVFGGWGLVLLVGPLLLFNSYGTRLTGKCLVNLGCAGHVPNNTPLTRDFEGHVRQFAAALSRRVWTRMAPMGSENFRIEPIGSFPCDTKVGDIDEFDYLCVSEIQQDMLLREENQKWKAKVILPGYLHFIENFHTACIDIIDALTLSSSDVTLDSHILHVSDFYKHGPATCVELEWICTQNHRHIISVDISLALEVKDKGIYNEKGERKWHPDIKCMYLRFYPELADVLLQYELEAFYSGISELPASIHAICSRNSSLWFTYKQSGKYNWELSSCMYDQLLFDAIEANISPDIRSVFRCLKILVNELLPIRIEKDQAGHRGFYASCVLDSHALKCLLFNQVKNFPDPKYWQEEELIKRIEGVLRDLAQTYKFDADGKYLHNVWPNYVETITKVKVSPSGGGLLHQSPGIEMHFWGLIKQIDDMARLNTTGSSRQSAMLEDGLYLKTWDGTFLKAPRVKAITLGPYSFIKPTAVAYDIVHEASLPHHNHPLIQWCRQHVAETCRRHQGVDLTLIPVKYLRYVWGLLYCELLKELDIRNGTYEDKIKRLEMLLDGSQDSLWETFLSTSVICPINPELVKFVSCKDVIFLRDVVWNINNALGSLLEEISLKFEPEFDFIVTYIAMSHILSDKFKISDFK